MFSLLVRGNKHKDISIAGDCMANVPDWASRTKSAAYCLFVY